MAAYQPDSQVLQRVLAVVRSHVHVVQCAGHTATTADVSTQWQLNSFLLTPTAVLTNWHTGHVPRVPGFF